MRVNEFIEKVVNDSRFQEWKKNHQDSYIVHVFFEEVGMQIGYYNKDDTMTSFSFENDELKITESEEIFKKDDKKLLKLDRDKIKIDFNQGLEKAKKLQQEYYKGHDPVKIISVLQHLAIGQVYNFTMITQTFQTINVKINTDSGEVIEHKLYSLMDLGEMKPGKSATEK
mgnify:CR=1 FL=1|tara:strand:+ start:8646 stop:9155 length:510 start_codon:yes stop_codon:yes gene_type:complete